MKTNTSDWPKGAKVICERSLRPFSQDRMEIKLIDIDGNYGIIQHHQGYPYFEWVIFANGQYKNAIVEKAFEILLADDRKKYDPAISEPDQDLMVRIDMGDNRYIGFWDAEKIEWRAATGNELFAGSIDSWSVIADV